MKTEIVTAETLEQFTRSHGAVRIGDTVHLREDPREELARSIAAHKRGEVYIYESTRRLFKPQ